MGGEGIREGPASQLITERRKGLHGPLEGEHSGRGAELLEAGCLAK